MKVRRGAALVPAAAFLGAVLSGCAGSHGLALARQACNDVNRSLAIYQSSQKLPASESQAEQEQALSQLRAALPIAASAAGEDSQWQALMTTLSESTRVPESGLVHALSAQCAVVESSGQDSSATGG